MVNKVWISYSESETVEYCCLNYFFQACGVWAVNYEERKTPVEGEVHLSILGVDEARSMPPYSEGHFYLVKRNSTSVSLKRNDVVIFKWKKADEGFEQLVRRLFQSAEERESMGELIKIFVQEKLWGAFWLYHEVAYEENPVWDTYISEICTRVKNMLEESDLFSYSWHHRFMSIYCDYILYAVSVNSTISRSVWCSDLLYKCEMLAQRDGWTPTLCILAARICRLSRQEEKYALNYYRSVRKYGDSSENLYDIGNAYEKLYGDYASAMVYYKESWQLNRNNYRSLYKIAVDMEDRKDWMNALNCYERIRLQLRRNTTENSISVRKIEYEYKVLKRIIWIVRLYIEDAKFMKLLQKELEVLQESLETRKDFRKLLHCMFGKGEEKDKEKEILKELQKRVMQICNK